MPLGLRLWLLLWIAGCAEQALVVPESDWNTVPAAQRAAIDHQYEADLAAARTELTAATASLAALPRTPPPPPKVEPRPSAPPARAVDSDDPWQMAMRDHEQARSDARGRVETSQADVYRTDAAWRQLRVDTARARLDMLIAQREVIRAQTINHNLPGDDTYDSAPLRGQFSRAQQRWYAVASRGRAARDAFEHATTDLASAKEAYAQIMRNGPAHLREPIASDDHPTHLELPGWVVLESDIRRRHGLRHFLDEGSTAQLLRKTTYQPSRAVRTSLPAVAGAPASSSAPTPPTAERAAAPAPATASSSKPAAPPPPAAPEHPADRAASAAPAAPSPRPIAPPAAAPPPAAARSGSPFDNPGPAVAAGKPATSKPAAAPAVAASKPAGTAPATAASSKPATSPPGAASGKPGAASPFDPRWSFDTPDRPAPPSPFDPKWTFDAPGARNKPATKPGAAAPPAAVSTTAKPEAARATPGPAAKPPRSTPPATSAAKPVDRADADAHPH
ncbi:MAG TPA: hypothetical protein VHW23_12130 [Kofleriaceae bacterium]|nr:hypothetical protein [Kofleriaceae bacterium]